MSVTTPEPRSLVEYLCSHIQGDVHIWTSKTLDTISCEAPLPWVTSMRESLPRLAVFVDPDADNPLELSHWRGKLL